MRLKRLLLIVSLAAWALITTGCERAIFRFANRGLPPPEENVVFADDIGLSMDVYRPRHAKGNAPVVVFFYGGAWQRGQKSQYRFVGRRLAENGILTIVADYRTYPRATFPLFMDDAARAVKKVHDNAALWGGDLQRLFLSGHSAGAQIAALLATDARYLNRYDINPDTLSGVIGLSGPYHFVVSGKLEQVFGSRDQWPQAQAVNYVSGDEPPFLLIHGLNDNTVESKDSAELAERLRANGVAVRLELLPEGTHSTPLIGLYDPQREPTVLQKILEFVKDSSDK